MRMSKHSSCLIHRNFLVGISYSDATPGQSFSYNHLGQLTQITDASGTRTFACNPYGEPETDCLEANGLSWQVSELYDGLGRPAGYELSAGERRVQQARLSYDGKGRLSALAAEGMETPFSWTYCEQGGLVEQLAYPNGMTRVNTYENSRDLLSVIDYRRPGSANPPARHEYDYDALGRPTRRRDTWNTAAPKTTRLFTYNSRGELVGDQLRPGGRFGYQYDNIGNRKEAFEFGSTTDYETDELNRYAGIAGNGAAAFVPQYDADGNQTLVKTSTGIWEVTYNAENRPVKFESEDGGTTVECAYDSMGRRFEKKVTVGGTTGFHACYLYRDYLQVAECDLTGETPEVVRSYIWDPSEPEATRVLSMTRWEANGTQEKEHLYCMHDAMKNVTSLFGEARGRRALYEYRPYGGLITSEGNMAQENKFRFSCEYMDDELGLIYYNYRHLNPNDGRWISRDPIAEQGGWNLFAFVKNNSIINFDYLGLKKCVTYNFGPLQCPASKGSLTGGGWAVDWSTSSTLAICFDKYKIFGDFSVSGEVGFTLGFATQKTKWGYTLFAMLGVRGFSAIAGTASIEGSIDPRTCNTSLEVKANTNFTLGLEGGAIGRVFKNNRLKTEVGVGARASVSGEAGAIVQCKNSDCEFQFYTEMNNSISYSIFANFGWFNLSYDDEKRLDILKNLSIESTPYKFEIPTLKLN